MCMSAFAHDSKDKPKKRTAMRTIRCHPSISDVNHLEVGGTCGRKDLRHSHSPHLSLLGFLQYTLILASGVALLSYNIFFFSAHAIEAIV